MASLVALFSLAAMSPVWYAIFGYPSPEHWRLPMETQCVEGQQKNALKQTQIHLKIISIQYNNDSSLMGRDNYMGFFVDWSIEVIATTTGYMTVILSALFYIGMYLYIDGMVNDMRMELMPNRPDSFKKPRHPLDQRKKWSIYVRQIEFHIEIIGYQLTSRFALISFNQSNESIF